MIIIIVKIIVIIVMIIIIMMITITHQNIEVSSYISFDRIKQCWHVSNHTSYT